MGVSSVCVNVRPRLEEGYYYTIAGRVRMYCRSRAFGPFVGECKCRLWRLHRRGCGTPHRHTPRGGLAMAWQAEKLVPT